MVSFLRLRWVKGVCVFRCNLQPVLLVERPESFTCYCGNTGLERTPNKSLHTKLTLEKKILPPLQPGFELATFRSRVRRSTNASYPGLWIYVVLIDTVRHFKAVLVCLECSEFICSSFGSRYQAFDMLTIIIIVVVLVAVNCIIILQI